MSENGVTNWRELNSGLPKTFIAERMERDSYGNFYLITYNSGIFKLLNGKRSWKGLNSRDFLIRSQLGKTNKYRKISAFSISDKFPDIVALATKHTLYLTKNGGGIWEKIRLRGLTHNNYITSIAIRGNKPEIIVGTSFNGIFKKAGNRFVKISEGLPKEPYSKSLFFYEEISRIAFDENNTDIIYTGLNFGGGVYRSLNGGRSWRDLRIPIGKCNFYHIYDIKHRCNLLLVSTSGGIYEMNIKSGEWTFSGINKRLTAMPDYFNPISVFIVFDRLRNSSIFCKLKEHSYLKQSLGNNTAKNRKAIYASIPSIRRSFNELKKTIKKSSFNSIVIDIKDDFGNIYFSSKNKTAIEIGAIKGSIRFEKLLKNLKENGIYTIARIVVFKDRNLFRAYKNKYAIWNRRYSKPWRGNPLEFWVDPHSEFVRSYNIEIAREISCLGFDEVQFDYIRFPSDGPVHQCLYRYREDKDIYKSEVLNDFLKQARKNIHLPISVDIYGFNAWYHFGNWIGQDVEEFARNVDVICPMVYPSHFGRFYMKGPREERSYRLVYNSGKRAISILGNGVVVRPYLQAFNLLSPTWGTGYIVNQVRGSNDSGCSGFTFWNAMGDYKMLRKALAQ